ncbi:MAG: tungstate ABC transporter substrate-binding protein WtpA [Candidatus Bathyarchaeota archaeon]|nr:tungstate ABC transporter substrate-binding protein WtpA [Candidatus Bathyarchaeota archaeon]
MRKTYAAAAVIIAVVLLASTYFFVFNNVFDVQPKQVIRMHCATSLEFPLDKLEPEFEKAYPNIDLQFEGHGTIQVIRHVTELNHLIDVVLVADYSLIPLMMYNTKMPSSDQNFGDYYIRFATNTMVLAYTNTSRYSNEVNADNWYEILNRSDVKLGFANPQLAALGYRALTVFQLAQDYYGEPTLFHDLISANMNPPINALPNGANYTITGPDTQQPKGDKLTLRSSEIDLIALLESGYLDYCFIYLSNARQYGFDYVALPDEINMGSAAYQSNYERVEVVYDHQRFATVNLDRTGETIYYGVTIPANAPHPELAEKFVEFLLVGQGKAVFDEWYHEIYSPAYTDNLQNVPESLQSLVTAEP